MLFRSPKLIYRFDVISTKTPAGFFISMFEHVHVNMGSGHIRGEPCGLKPREPVSLNCTGRLGLCLALRVGRRPQTCLRFNFPLTKLGLEDTELILFFYRNKIMWHVCSLVLCTKVHLASRKGPSKFC